MALITTQAQGRQDQQRTLGCNSMTVLVFLNIIFMLIAIFWVVGNGDQNWLNGQSIGKPFVAAPVGSRAPIRARSEREALDNAEGLVKRNGIDLNGPNWNRKVLDIRQPR